MTKSKTSVVLIDYSIFNGNLNQIGFDQKILINTINQYSFCIAAEDIDFKKSLQDSDILLPDGMAIVSAVSLLTEKKNKKDCRSRYSSSFIARA
jgi:N-acetylglucosaminyldiphosphoundecaprenol N-acetyl-beta-D-mannosaminyltransferase